MEQLEERMIAVSSGNTEVDSQIAAIENSHIRNA